MKELTNTETYEFISKELTYYPELPQFSAEELDCFRICDACGEPMLDGFVVQGANHYCSEDCFHTVMTEEEYMKEHEECDSDTFGTMWFDNSRRYITE